MATGVVVGKRGYSDGLFHESETQCIYPAEGGSQARQPKLFSFTKWNKFFKMDLKRNGLHGLLGKLCPGGIIAAC